MSRVPDLDPAGLTAEQRRIADETYARALKHFGLDLVACTGLCVFSPEV